MTPVGFARRALHGFAFGLGFAVAGGTVHVRCRQCGHEWSIA